MPCVCKFKIHARWMHSYLIERFLIFDSHQEKHPNRHYKVEKIYTSLSCDELKDIDFYLLVHRFRYT